MEPFVGEVFEGRVSSITSFGLFVELDNGIDGLVHIATLSDDYYFFDEEHFLMVGRNTGKEYHLGQTVTVTLVKADSAKKQIDFVLGAVEDISYFLSRMNRRMGGKPSGGFSSVFSRSAAMGGAAGKKKSKKGNDAPKKDKKKAKKKMKSKSKGKRR